MTEQEKAQALGQAKELREKNTPYSLVVADHIERLVHGIESLELENMELRIKMQGDCGVCAHRNDPKMCAVCLGHEDRPAWAYEGSSL